MNNLVQMLLNVARAGGNPMALAQQMASQHPEVARALKMIEGKSPQQLQTMVVNMAKEQGMAVEDVFNALGISMPR